MMEKKQLKGLILKEKGEKLKLSIHPDTFDTYRQHLKTDNCGWLHFDIDTLQSQHYNGKYFKIKPEKQ